MAVGAIDSRYYADSLLMLAIGIKFDLTIKVINFYDSRSNTALPMVGPHNKPIANNGREQHVVTINTASEGSRPEVVLLQTHYFNPRMEGVDVANCYNWRSDHFDLARESGVPAVHSIAETEDERNETMQLTGTLHEGMGIRATDEPEQDEGMGIGPTHLQEFSTQAAQRRY